MPSDLPQPVSYHRFDPLNDELDESHLPAVHEPDASETVVAATNSGQAAHDADTDSGPIFDSEELTASEAEERRAGQLLDRAFALWEKGDTAGAILACRQSLTLSPRSAPAFSMLGLLLEKTGDTNGAIAAYEKAVEIEPSSLLERDSARRLRASLGQALPTQFHFQDAELFEPLEQETEDDLATNASNAASPNTSNLVVAPFKPEAAEPKPAEAAGQAPVAPSSTRLNATTTSQVATEAVAAAVVSPSAPSPAAAPAEVAGQPPAVATSGAPATQATTVRTPAVPTAAPPTAAPPTAAPPRARPVRTTLPTPAPQAAPQTTVAPAAVAARPGGLESAPRATPSTTTSVAAAPVVAPAAAPAVVAPVATPPVVQAGTASSPTLGAPSRLDAMIGSRSTFWTRSLPLMAVAGTGFLFLLWSRGIASDRERRATPTQTTIINNAAAPSVARGNTANGAAEAENGAANGATSVTNNGATGTGVNSAAANSATANGATANGATSTVVPGASTQTSGATPNGATPNANAAAAGGPGAQSSTQSPVAEPQIAPSGLVVSNAPVPARRASSSVERTPSQREDTPRAPNRRDEPARTRRAFRSEERPARRTRSAVSGAPANSGGASSVLRQPDVRLIPPASVTQLPRAQEPSPRAENPASGNALLPVPPGASSADSGASGGLQPYAGPLPSFPSPSQVQSRAQSEMRPRSPSPASEASSGIGEAAYRYQTRALIYVGEGDNARAAADFQSAMALYRRQIARRENVAEARRGLQACLKGLRLISAS